LTGKPFARYWLHSEFLLVDGQKMSKSLGNFYTLRDLCADRGFAPEAIRYLLASIPYRKGLNFTIDGLRGAATSIERLRNFALRLGSAKLQPGVSERMEELSTAAQKTFRESLDDDINTAEALAAVFEYVREANVALDSGEFLAGNGASARALLDQFDSFFDVLEPSAVAGGLSDQEIENLIAERTSAKKARDFPRADQIRAQLLEKNVILEDTKDGIRWKRK
jgi:cysteinyl-tRNA synthetase